VRGTATERERKKKRARKKRERRENFEFPLSATLSSQHKQTLPQRRHPEDCLVRVRVREKAWRT
jgi:hypothetical protein